MNRTAYLSFIGISLVALSAAIFLLKKPKPPQGNFEFSHGGPERPSNYHPKPGDIVDLPFEPETGEPVPPLEGLNPEDPEVKEFYLTNTELKFVVKGYERSETVPKGSVIWQNPSGGKSADPGTEVQLYLSSGAD